MKAIRIENPGPGYRLVLGEAERPHPGPSEVLIKVVAAGINRADLLQARGHYPPPPGASPILGLEVAGTVAAAGAAAAQYKIGDEVCALLTGGGYAEYALAHVSCVLPVPKHVTMMDAAALPEAHFTAWTNLMDAGRLQPGESVLVHGGASGIGTAAIQLLAALRHTVFATAGSEGKIKTCLELGARRAIDYRSEDFVAVIKQETDGRGVDVILDMVGGDYIRRNIEAAALWGRIVNIAYQNGAEARINFAPVIAKRLTLAATTLRARTQDEKAAIRDALAATVWPLIAERRIRPVIDGVFPLAEAIKAHERMAEGSHIGKILLIS